MLEKSLGNGNNKNINVHILSFNVFSIHIFSMLVDHDCVT